MEKYQALKEQYPDYVSLDQFYRICGIAKRSALYLVQNGIDGLNADDFLRQVFQVEPARQGDTEYRGKGTGDVLRSELKITFAHEKTVTQNVAVFRLSGVLRYLL